MDDEKLVTQMVETVTEYEVSDRHRGEFEKTLGAKLAELIDETFKQGAPIEEVVGSVAQVLHSLASFETGGCPADGKAVSVLVEPYECGCLCIQVREVVPSLNYDDDGNLETGCKPN